MCIDTHYLLLFFEETMILPSRNAKKAFTLVELLVVIAIIGILIGMLLPAVQQVREAARRTSCANNIRQLALACHNYESAIGELPPGLYQNFDPSSSIRNYGYTWFVAILPYMEENNVYKLWNFTDTGTDAMTNGLDAAGNATQAAPTATVIESFLCPSDNYRSPVVELTYTGNGYPNGFFGLTSYLGNCGTYSTYFQSSAMQDDGIFFMTGPGSGAPWQPNLVPNAPAAGMLILDGTSSTFMIGERYHNDPNFEAIIRPGGSTSYSRYAIDEWGRMGLVRWWKWYDPRLGFDSNAIELPNSRQCDCGLHRSQQPNVFVRKWSPCRSKLCVCRWFGSLYQRHD